MTKILLVFDEEDVDIGSFNQGCLEDYQEYFNEKPYVPTYINSRQLNALNVELKVKELGSRVIVAYSHGEPGRLFGREGEYISTTTNVACFEKHFFYTVACHTAIDLGNHLINNGCSCYFGYKSLFNSWLGYKEFSICANFGFFRFLEGANSSKIYNEMLQKYDEIIDALYVQDFFISSLLRENRDGLIMLGIDLSIKEIHE